MGSDEITFAIKTVDTYLVIELRKSTLISRAKNCTNIVSVHFIYEVWIWMCGNKKRRLSFYIQYRISDSGNKPQIVDQTRRVT